MPRAEDEVRRRQAVYELRHEIQEGEQGRWVSFYYILFGHILMGWVCCFLVALNILGGVMWGRAVVSVGGAYCFGGQWVEGGGWGCSHSHTRRPGSARAKYHFAAIQINMCLLRFSCIGRMSYFLGGKYI